MILAFSVSLMLPYQLTNVLFTRRIIRMFPKSVSGTWPRVLIDALFVAVNMKEKNQLINVLT